MEAGHVSWYLVVAGFLLLMLGVLLVFVGVFASAMSGGAGRVEAGGVVFIGPIPVVFGTSARAVLLAAVLAIIMAFVYLALLFFFVKRVSTA